MGLGNFKNSVMIAAAIVGAAATASADVKFGGDVRYRWSNITTNTGASGASDVSSAAQLYRGRLWADGMVDDQWSARFRFTTAGTNVINAATTNLEMKGRKTTYFDQLYMTYKPMADLSITAGKNTTVMWQAGGHEANFGLDVGFDGLTVQYSMTAGPVKPFVKLGYYTIVENTTGTDPTMAQAQLGVKWANDNMNATVAYGMYQTNSLVGTNLLTSGIAPNTTTQHSTTMVSGAGVVAKEFKVSDIEAEFGMTTGIAWALYAGMMSNSEASSENNASIFGVKLGALKDAGSWQVTIDSRDIKRDAVMSWLGDATFGGGPATYEGKGLKLTGAYKVSNNLTTTLWYHDAKTGSVANGVEAKHSRYYLQADLTF